MLVQPHVLQRMAEEKEEKKTVFSVLTRSSSRKLTTRSTIGHEIRNHRLDFRKVYRLRIAA